MEKFYSSTMEISSWQQGFIIISETFLVSGMLEVRTLEQMTGSILLFKFDISLIFLKLLKKSLNPFILW